jgi:hypothetical protein
MTSPALKLQGGYHEVASDPIFECIAMVSVGLTDDIEFSVGHLFNSAEPGLLPAEYPERTTINVKYNIPFEQLLGMSAEGDFDVAIGANDVTDQANRAVYLAFSKHFPIDLELDRFVTVHAGFGDTEWGYGRLDGFFGGIDYQATDDMSFQVEYDAEDINGCLRYYPVEWGSLDVGFVDEDFAYGLTFRSVY